MVLGDVIGPSDALVVVAAIGAFGTFATTIIAARRAKRGEQAARAAARNTQPNGIPDADGHVGPPSAYDVLLASHEYMIGLTHAIRDQAAEATKAAYLAQAAIKQNDVITQNLAQRVDEGFAAAKAERDVLAERVDVNITEGAQFASAIIAGALDLVGRVDALDGRSTLPALQARVSPPDELESDR